MSERKVPITVYLENAQLSELAEIHAEHGTPLSTMVRMAVKFWLAKRKEQKETEA